MLKEVTKVVVLAATSALTVPYMVALVANMLYGWPQGPRKYRRALAPRKVFALNYAILQQLDNLRFARLYFRWQQFYREAMVMRLLKDIPFGSHDNKLDLYFPRQTAAHMKETLPQPVVVFIYGGAWGSGDKNMYGLLGAQVADNLNAIVCIPNYSIYPRGYVDDMVQDVVDCLSWVHTHIDKYGGDKECILLVGHSAGAHLSVMATIELTLKRLLHNPQAIIRPDGDVTPPPASLTQSFQLGQPGSATPLNLSFRSQAGGSTLESIRFEDRHFDGSSHSGSENAESNAGVLTPRHQGVPTGAESASTTGSFFFVSEDGKERRLSASAGSESFFMVTKGTNNGGTNDSSQPGNGSSSRSEDNSDPPEELDLPTEGTEPEPERGSPPGAELTEKEEDGSGGAGEDLPPLQPQQEPETQETAPEHAEGAPSEAVSSLPVTSQVEAPRPKSPMELVIEDNDAMTRSQREVRDLLQSIRCFIGLAGVYDIVDHFEHESGRGVEDISSMGKAMYGPEHFHRFSPTQILATLPHRTRFPPVLLVHGDSDYIVPVSSTERFATAVSDLGSQVVEYRVPGCPHVDLCFDLMDPHRTYHDISMGILRQAAQTYAK